MVSSTQQFERIRKRKATQNGKWNKRARRRNGTPEFPIHPVGYDPTAADARQSPQAPRLPQAPPPPPRLRPRKLKDNHG